MIKDLSHVPNKPGVYQFFNQSKIIYIGKAKDLKKEFVLTLLQLLKIEKQNKLKNKLLK